MNNPLQDKKEHANALRKSGNIEEALILYKELWNLSKDKFDGSGLLYCLRKLKLFDEAVIFADELIQMYANFNWCKTEVVWTYIEGRLNFINSTFAERK